MEDIICRTVDTLRRGGVILYPTDTIWGIGCNAQDANAVERLYDIKERDHTKSMLVLCCAEQVASGEWRAESESRPTTYILPKAMWQPLLGGVVAANLPAADGSLGVRVPNHSFCCEVIQRLGAPLVSTSANLSGHPSPATYHDIEKELFERVDYSVPPLEEFLSTETRGSRIIKINSDGSQTVLRP